MICKKLLHNAEIDLAGNIQPCSNFNGAIPCRSYNIVEFHSHTRYLEIVEEHANDIKNPECQSCWDDEALGITSLRQYGNQQLQDTSNESELLTLDIGLDHFCNLQCITCNEQASSSILVEKQLNEISFVPFKISPTHIHMDFIYRVLPQLTELKIYNSGEPLSSKRMVPLLKKIKSLNPNLKVMISTNATRLDQGVLQDLKEIPNLEVQISVDGRGLVNELIRWGSDWPTVNSVIDQLLDLNCYLHSVITPLNVMDIPNIIDYAATKGLPITFSMAKRWDHTLEVIPTRTRQELIPLLKQSVNHVHLDSGAKQFILAVIKILEEDNYSLDAHARFSSWVRHWADRRQAQIDQYLPYWSKIA